MADRIFQRIEKKYLISGEQYRELLTLIGGRLTPDSHGKSTICNAYLDTPDFLLIRNSIDAKGYKEKLRLRSYGTPLGESRVFLEIKKKYKGIVYKRREIMTYAEAMDYIVKGKRPFDSQIMNEMDYAIRLYGSPQPSIILCYDREAYYAKDVPELRITFDTNVRYRFDELYLDRGCEGKSLLPSDSHLMEIKTGGAMPLWLAGALDTLKIYPTSFSKYGKAYLQRISENNTIKEEKKDHA